MIAYRCELVKQKIGIMGFSDLLTSNLLSCQYFIEILNVMIQNAEIMVSERLNGSKGYRFSQTTGSMQGDRDAEVSPQTICQDL